MKNLILLFFLVSTLFSSIIAQNKKTFIRKKIIFKELNTISIKKSNVSEKETTTRKITTKTSVRKK